MAQSTTPGFDHSQGYQRKGETYFDDGREMELLHFVYSKSNIDEIRNNPAKVAAAIDEFARTRKYLMNIGSDKGNIVREEIATASPKIMVELGGYVGYSSIIFGDAFRKAGGEKYYTLENNAEFAAVIMSLVDLAGLREVVRVVVGDSDHSLRRLHGEGILKQVDLLFIDHTRFVEDLRLCERLKMIGPGSVVVADNCIYPGHPDYRKYVESTVEEKRRAAQTEKDSDRVGNPGLVYESRLVRGFEPSGEPDGVEISYCVKEEES